MSIIKPSTIAGVMELLPEEQFVFNKIKKIIENTFEENGFVSIETPLIEKDDILFAKGAGETEKQIFRIESDTKKMSLRYDLTVPLARYVSQHFSDLTFPFKRYQIGKVYRGERNQKGRYKEFYQCDIDIIGKDTLSILNDASLPYVIYNVFKKLNFEEVTFHVNNRKLLNGFFESLGIEKYSDVLRIIDKLAKIGKENTKKELLEYGLSIDVVNEILLFISNDLNNKDLLNELSLKNKNGLYNEGLNELEKVYYYMLEFGIPEKNIKLDLSITRGLDYYTSTVYETMLNGYEEIGSVCSGGRYENLAENFSNQKLPGVGMSIGLTRLFYQLENLKLTDKFMENQINALFIPMSDEYNFYSIEGLNSLRKNKIKADIYLEGGKAKKKFNYANKINAKYSIIVGEEEFKNKKFSVKNMENGEQITIDKADLVEFIKNNL
ncbi:MAG: histidine--tRNA ligase [Peptoniphilaceae bacterium]|nr:histidine--tRNA ligase [Peptoniphilaceae bacterium]MDD7383436.1 histidine--tRNA ligase [Peptoniphilaceae bacterium]MDY3738500.1 histidine--tRNA ligase [Peptoniphilaceae bacterium]